MEALFRMYSSSSVTSVSPPSPPPPAPAAEEGGLAASPERKAPAADETVAPRDVDLQKKELHFNVPW